MTMENEENLTPKDGYEEDDIRAFFGEEEEEAAESETSEEAVENIEETEEIPEAEDLEETEEEISEEEEIPQEDFIGEEDEETEEDEIVEEEEQDEDSFTEYSEEYKLGDNEPMYTQEEESEEDDEHVVRVMIVTADNIIAGNLQYPQDLNAEEMTDEEIMFNTLNRGNQFIALRRGSIMDKDNSEFEPERVPFYVLNLDIVQSCRIVNTKKRV